MVRNAPLGVWVLKLSISSQLLILCVVHDREIYTIPHRVIKYTKMSRMIYIIPRQKLSGTYTTYSAFGMERFAASESHKLREVKLRTVNPDILSEDMRPTRLLLGGVSYGSFRKFAVPSLGVLFIRTLLFGVLPC